MTTQPLWWGMAALVALAAAAVLTGLARAAALAAGVIDRPNARSLHAQATPRAGGVAIFVTVTAGLLYLHSRHAVSPEVVRALLFGGTAIAAVGLVDDWGGLRPSIRLLVHVAAAVWAVYCIAPTLIPHSAAHAGRSAGLGVLAVVAVVWLVNLFNFMDGIDGLAAMEGTTVGLAAAVLAILAHTPDVAAVAWLFAFACGGFLYWNWPPARVFLGDVGSGYLGYVIAVLALADTQQRPIALWTWFILCSVFAVDATLTLLLRCLRAERVLEPHRQHAYQRLARRWHSHRRVTSAVLLINVLGLFPAALLTTLHPQWAPATVALTVFPLVLVALWAGAGRMRVGAGD